MLLDYVLGEPNADWYATEQDKVALFTTRFGITPTDLPRRVYLARRASDADTCRYFIHKMPIRLFGAAPFVSFVSLVTDTTGAGFGQFLQDHVRLLNRLPAWQIVAVAPRHLRGLQACSAAFRWFSADGRPPRLRGEDATLLRFFRIRECVDRNAFESLTVEDLDLFPRGLLDLDSLDQRSRNCTNSGGRRARQRFTTAAATSSAPLSTRVEATSSRTSFQSATTVSVHDRVSADAPPFRE